MESVPENTGSSHLSPEDSGKKVTLTGFAGISGNNSPGDLMNLLLQNVRDQAIFTTDPDNVITSWNTGAYNLFGFSAEEAIGQTGEIIFTHEDRAAGEPAKEIAMALTDGHALDERYHMRKDGSILFVSGALSPLFTSTGQLLGFVKMARDLTERKEMEQRLNLANRRKDEFIAMLGHELRNPLSPVRNSLQILKMTHAEDTTLMPLVDMMLRQIDHMVVLVNDLLDVSRISQGKIKLRTRRVDVNALIRESVKNMRLQLGSSKRKWSVDLPKKPLFVNADEFRLVQVINNILHNAVKYTPHDGQVRVMARQSESQVIIGIKDDGTGIARDNLTDIFESFVQIETTIDRAGGGLGLGLAVVKKLVELHQGTIHAESAGLGLGSEFIIQLPSAD